jgi:chromosome segregation ATPase
VYASVTMDDTNQMLRAIINGQSAMKSELIEEIHKVDQKVDKLDKKIDGVDSRLTEIETNLTNRMDKLGLQIARLEDDAATRDEFDNLDERVTRLEQSATSV